MSVVQDAEKQKFVNELIKVITAVGVIQDQLPPLSAIFFDRGYNAAGGDPIIDIQISNTGITAEEVASAITTLSNLDKFFNAGSPANDAYRITINKLRNDK